LAKKLLIIRLSSIGDIVLCTPVIRCIKEQTNFEIHFLTKPEYKEILEKNPYIDYLHVLDKSALAKGKELNLLHFNVVVDLHKNIRTLIIKHQIKNSLKLSFNKINIQKWIKVNFKKYKLPNKHIVDRYLDTVASLDVKNDYQGLDYFINNNEFVNASKIIPLPQSYAAWAIGAQHNTKKMPAKKIIHILNHIQIPIVLLGNASDYALAQEITNTVTSNNIINACGKLTLNQSAAIIKQAKFVISNDSGLMHIAAAHKKPVISLWGSTIPQFGMYPYYGNIQVKQKMFEINNLNCRPCSKIGFNKCPKGHFKCMNHLPDDAITHAINTFTQ